MKRKLFLSVVFGILSLFPISALAQDSNVKSLQGIRRIQVLIENIDEEGERVISANELKQMVESRLKRRGITVVVDSDRDDRYNYLYVNLNAVSLSNYTVYNIELSFHQMVSLMTGDRMMAVTWQKSMIATAGYGAARSQGRDIIDQLLDKFLDDYSTAN